jgi:hypothetical protein
MFNEQKIYSTLPDHVSPGEMTTEEPQHFNTTHQYFDDLNIDIIEPFNQIPDYLGKTMNSVPTILNTSGRYICLDGWHLLEEARQKQQENIRCLIEVINNCSDEEIGFFISTTITIQRHIAKDGDAYGRWRKAAVTLAIPGNGDGFFVSGNH